MSKLIEEISEKSIEHGSIPFWSWNDRLEENELRRQIRNMKQLGMRGFFMHARGGLETEYMSEQWFDCIKACVDEAKKLGMEAWSYDENGWPSGFAGGKLLEDAENHARFIEASYSDAFPESNDFLAVYALQNGVPNRVCHSDEKADKYLVIKEGSDSSYVDTMRGDITDKFIEATHNEYKKKLGEDFGKAMPGFFTDEPQYYRWKTPYSNKMEEWFEKEYGYSVLDALPALFIDYPGAELHRYDYHKLTNKKFTENFSKRIYDWAEQNGIAITGHFIEERDLAGQMLCCGDIMPQYLYEHIPGVDYLGRWADGDLMGKQLGSVCEQMGKKQAISEMFACCGWDVTPRELKIIAELQYSGGVNLMCQHLYPYSIRGQRKRDYPAFYSEHNLWQSDLGAFNKYFNNLGYILSMGKEFAPVLVIHPIHSMWLCYQREPIERVDSDLDLELDGLSKLLSGNQIFYHYGSETIMSEYASVEGNKLKIGLCEYSSVVIPACDTLDLNTVKLLKEYIKNGGKVYTYKRTPKRIDGRAADLSFLDCFEDISDPSAFERFKQDFQILVKRPKESSERDLRVAVRESEHGRLIYLTNLSDKALDDICINVRDCKMLESLDILTLERASVAGKAESDGSVSVKLDLDKNESIVLFESESGEFLDFAYKKDKRPIALENKLSVRALDNNMLTLDRACISLNDGEFSELRPIERIRDELLSSRYKGKMKLSFPFELSFVPEKLDVVCEPFGSDFIFVNGQRVKTEDRFAIDRSFSATDISKYCRIGQNSIEMEYDYFQRDYVYYVLYGGVSETLRNCLVFDTEIECIYLSGNFCVETQKDGFSKARDNVYVYSENNKMTIGAPKEISDASNIVTQGYPFYCGRLELSGTLVYKKGDPTTLKLDGRYSTAQIEVNQQKAASLIMSEWADIGRYLKEGENHIKITLCNSYRNLLGPHHFKDPEPTGLGPWNFSFEKGWDNGNCSHFEYRYSFVRYGVDI